MNFTDYLRLSELKIFKNVREGIPKDSTKTTNLLAIRDNVLYVWDLANSCVLTLNVKAARSRDGDNVTHQSLLPLTPALFTPESLQVNDAGTLLIVSGPTGVLVMELPARYPPYGAFDHNKELVYCRSHSLDERLLICGDAVEVRQVRFHPGSVNDNHVLVLTSDNTLRLYNVENGTASSVATYQIGDRPGGLFPGTKISYLAAFGEVGVDFDFGYPELEPPLIKTNETKLVWPIYVLRGDGNVTTINIPLDNKTRTLPKPVVSNSSFGTPKEEACSVICLNSNPQILCVATSNGTIYHSVLLPSSNCGDGKELMCFESVELELGLSTSDDDDKWNCPIFLHKDEAKIGRYFATHSAGFHAITVTCLQNLQDYVSGPDADAPLEDVFGQASKAEYRVCTRATPSDLTNPVIGFALYYDPTSLVALLGTGHLVTLEVLTTVLPKIDEPPAPKIDQNSSPLKEMLREPFDRFVENILRPSSNQPILKLVVGSNVDHSQKECYELLQRASQVFRDDYFKNHNRARGELEKRAKALEMMKMFQLKELDRMNGEKHQLQRKAENLAEKYEDIKDKQEVIKKRCEKLLLLVSQKKSEPSDAEREFLEELKRCSEKVEEYKNAIKKLKLKVKYQQIQIENWKAEEAKRSSTLATNFSDVHSTTIKTNLKEMSQKIADMVKEIKEHKKRLNLK